MQALRKVTHDLRSFEQTIPAEDVHVDVPSSKTGTSAIVASGTPAENGTRINLSQTNQQIAARIGSVREVVSRAFARSYRRWR